jgi:hypothetical protein
MMMEKVILSFGLALLFVAACDYGSDNAKLNVDLVSLEAFVEDLDPATMAEEAKGPARLLGNLQGMNAVRVKSEKLNTFATQHKLTASEYVKLWNRVLDWKKESVILVDDLPNVPYEFEGSKSDIEDILGAAKVEPVEPTNPPKEKDPAPKSDKQEPSQPDVFEDSDGDDYDDNGNSDDNDDDGETIDLDKVPDIDPRLAIPKVKHEPKPVLKEELKPESSKTYRNNTDALPAPKGRPVSAPSGGETSCVICTDPAVEVGGHIESSNSSVPRGAFRNVDPKPSSSVCRPIQTGNNTWTLDCD